MNERTHRVIEDALSMAGAGHLYYRESDKSGGGWFALEIGCQFDGYKIAAYPSTPVINGTPKDDLVREAVLLSVLAIYKQVLMRAVVLAHAGKPVEEIQAIEGALIGPSTLRDRVQGFITSDAVDEPAGLTVVPGGAG